MNLTSEDIIKQTSQLSANEKIELIDALLATVDKPDAEIDALWAKEAEGRLAAYQNGEIQALDLNQVLAKYR
jgi:putative addiction module component (TIGR02574 family)